MHASGERHWLRATVIVGVAYLIAGVGFGALADVAGPGRLRAAWRLAAWLVSAAAFAAHIGYEHFRLRSTPRAAASHVAGAVALGAFGLAVVANLHPHDATLGNRLRISLVVWPLLTAVPALLLALALAAGLTRARRGA